MYTKRAISTTIRFFSEIGLGNTENRICPIKDATGYNVAGFKHWLEGQRVDLGEDSDDEALGVAGAEGSCKSLLRLFQTVEVDFGLGVKRTRPTRWERFGCLASVWVSQEGRQ